MIDLAIQGSNTQNTTQNEQDYSDVHGNIPTVTTVKMEEENSHAVHHDLDKLKPIEMSNPFVNGMEDEPQWKKSICSKGIYIADKRFPTSIHHKYSLLSKTNPRLSSCIKAITQQIRHQILKPVQSPKIQQKKQIQAFQAQLSQKKQVNKTIITEQIIPDKAIVKESCYRGLLKPTQIDNDVPSDEQDLNNGIRYMYGELLYSVGSEMINQRQSQKHQKTKPIAKQHKKPEHDKENINTNLPQEAKAKPKAKVPKTNQRLVKPKGDIIRPNLMVRH